MCTLKFANENFDGQKKFLDRVTYVQVTSGLVSVSARRDQHSAALVHRLLAHEHTTRSAVIIGTLVVAFGVDVVDLHPKNISNTARQQIQK